MAELEQAAEVVEELVESSNAGRLLAIGALAGFAIGTGVGILIAKKLWQKKYEELMESEQQRLRDHYAAKAVAVSEKPALDKLVDELGYVPPPAKEVLVGHLPDTDPPVSTEENEIIVNAFHEREYTDEWDYAAEEKIRVQKRKDRVPYIIHRDEYEEGDLNYEQENLTYFEGDDVLCDVHDEVVDQDDTVGVEPLGKFGHGSKDINIVYVRNNELGIDYEIVHSDGSFAEEVHGLKPEVRHSAEGRMRRQQFDDD